MAKGAQIRLFHATTAGALPPAGSLTEGELALDALSSPAKLWTQVPTSRDPSGRIDLLSDGAPTLPLAIANGGTGAITGPLAFDNLLNVSGTTAGAPVRNAAGQWVLDATGPWLPVHNPAYTGSMTGTPWILHGLSWDGTSFTATDTQGLVITEFHSASNAGMYLQIAGNQTVGQPATTVPLIQLAYYTASNRYVVEVPVTVAALALLWTSTLEVVNGALMYGAPGGRALSIVGWIDIPGPYIGDDPPGVPNYSSRGNPILAFGTDAGYVGNGPRGDGTLNPPDGEFGWSWSQIALGSEGWTIQTEYRENDGGPGLGRVRRLWLGQTQDHPSPPTARFYPIPLDPALILDATTSDIRLEARTFTLSGDTNLPSVPVEGMLWNDTGTHELKYYDGTAWRTINMT